VNQIGWFASGALLFLTGAGVILFGPHTGNDDVIGLGLVAIIAGSLCLGIGAWRVYTRVDWKRVEAEQRLWESGSVGRVWLQIRKTLTGR
jgi:hypothetical protein